VSFVAPLILLALVLVPVAIFAYVRFDRSRKTDAPFASEALMPAVAPRRARWRRHVAPAFYLLALAGLIFAAARPQAKAEVKVEKASVMLVTDRSGSMRADDVPGGRIAAARSAGELFLDTVPKDVRAGLIAFNQNVELLVSPTTDRDAMRAEVNSLTPAGSTAAGDALQEALRVLRPQTGANAVTPTTDPKKRIPAAIILLSDGESVRGSDPVEAAKTAKSMGVPIYTIALGTDAGVLKTTKKDGTTREQKVPPDRETLKQVAELSGGKAFTATDQASLDAVYKQLGSQVAKRQEVREVTSRVAGISLVLLLAGATASLAMFGRLP
jgi:Ca-activated chloride channel family protein